MAAVRRVGVFRARSAQRGGSRTGPRIVVGGLAAAAAKAGVGQAGTVREGGKGARASAGKLTIPKKDDKAKGKPVKH